MRVDAVQPWQHPAAQTLIGGFNRVYQAAFGTTYRVLDAIGVSYYGIAPIGASFQMEFFALTNDTRAIIAAIDAYPRGADQTFILNVFHADPLPTAMIADYAALGYRQRRTTPILSLSLPAPRMEGGLETQISVERLAPESLAAVNDAFSIEGEVIPPGVVVDVQIHNFVARWDGVIASYTQLVILESGGIYLNQLFTLSAFRERGVGGALLRHATEEAETIGAAELVLIPSAMAASFYGRRGFKPALYFSVFEPQPA